MISAIAACPDKKIFAKRTVPGYSAEVWLFKKTVFKLIPETNKNESFVCFSSLVRLYLYLSFNQFWDLMFTQNSIPEEKWKDNRSDVHINKI